MFGNHTCVDEITQMVHPIRTVLVACFHNLFVPAENGAMLILDFFCFLGVFGLSCVFLVLFGVFVSFYYIVLSIFAILFDFMILSF